jgi:putative ABC transport system permease protein
MRSAAARLWWHWFPLGRSFAWLQLRSDPLRFAAAVAGIAFAAVMVTFQLGLYEALTEGAVIVHRSLRGDLMMISRQYEFIAINEGFTERRLAQARALPEVASVATLHVATGKWRNPVDGHFQTIVVFGIRPGEAPFALPELEASAPMLLREGAGFFDRLSRPSYGHVTELFETHGPFDTELNRQHLRIEGLFTLGTTLAVDANLVVGEQTFFTLFPQAPEGFTNVGLIRLRPGADPVAVRDRLLAFLPPDVNVLTPEQYAQIEKDYWTGKTPIGFVINAGLIVGLVVGAVIVYQILYTDVTEHLPEYATLKAMGYDDRFFAGLVAGQALILTVLGYVPGVITALGVFRLMTAMSSLNPQATPATLAIVFVLIAGMCAVAGAFATRKLRQARPAEIF